MHFPGRVMIYKVDTEGNLADQKEYDASAVELDITVFEGTVIESLNFFKHFASFTSFFWSQEQSLISKRESSKHDFLRK